MLKINNGNRNFLIGMFVLMVLLTFGVRSLVYYREAGVIKAMTGTDFVPFLIESAVMYDYSQQVANGKSIAGCDSRLGGGLEKVPVDKQMMLGLEYFLGWSYRAKVWITGAPVHGPDKTAFEDNPDFTAFARMQIRFWISLVGGLIFLWLILLRVPWPWAVMASSLYAISPAAIARYTGQDLVRGEFCMPFIVLAFVLVAWIMRRPAAFKYILLCLVTLAAFAFWDAPQFVFTFWAGLEILRLLVGGEVTLKRRNIWLVIYIGIVLAALLVPYQRYHGLIASPVVMVVMPLLLLLMFTANRLKGFRFLLTALLALIALLTLWKLLPGYGQNYSHFGELIKAKLFFLNDKPVNPAKLSFDARILWTPALHSADWLGTFFLFPAALWVMMTAAAIMLLCRKTRNSLRRLLPRDFYIHAFTIIFIGMYVFFVRAHAFAIIFLCLSFALLLDCWWKTRRQYGSRNLWNCLVLILATLTIMLELTMSILLNRSYPSSYFKETVGLIKWFRASQLQDVTVLTDMNLSPMLKGYCGSRIITQPQFELKPVRDLVQDYIMHLYHSREDEFAALCAKLGVDIVIFDRCNSYEIPMHIYTNRYMANAKTIKRFAPAWVMEKYPRTMRYFHQVPPPPGMEFISKTYFVFRFITPEQRDRAAKAAELAEYFFYSGKTDMAKKMAQSAYAQAPNLDKAYLVYYKVFGKTPDDCLLYLGKMRREETGK